MQEVTFLNKVLGFSNWVIVALFLIWSAKVTVSKFIDAWAKKKEPEHSNGNGNGKGDTTKLVTLTPEQIKAMFTANCEVNQKVLREETDRKIDKIGIDVNRWIESHQKVSRETHQRIDGLMDTLLKIASEKRE